MSSLSKGNLSEIADIYSGIHSPKTHQENLSESVEVISEEVLDDAAFVLTDALVEYLVDDKKLAEDHEQAITIIQNMSDEWVDQILSEKMEGHISLIEEIQTGNQDLTENARLKAAGTFVNSLWKGAGKAANYVKGTVAKDLRKNFNIPAGQSVGKELAKRAVSNTSRVATGSLRRAGDAVVGTGKALRGAWDATGTTLKGIGGYLGDRGRHIKKAASLATGVGDKARTPFGIRKKVNTVGAIGAGSLGLVSTGDMITTGGYQGSATQKIVDAAKGAISSQLNQQSKPQPSTPDKKDDKKKVDPWSQI
jgi:hypothetical protein